MIRNTPGSGKKPLSRWEIGMRISGVDAVIFSVSDLEACRRFWLDFGLSAVASPDGTARLMTTQGSVVELRGPQPSRLAPRLDGETGMAGAGAPDLVETIWGVGSAAALEAVGAELARDRAVSRDDDGTLHSIDDTGCRIGFRIARLRPADPAPSRVNAPGRAERINTAITFPPSVPVRRIGHVVLHVPDCDAAAAFYRHRLHFRLSDDFRGRGVFLRADGSNCHHNLFLIARDSVIRVNHVSFEVDDFHALMMGGIAMAQRGWQTRHGPGRHRIGSNYFWYFENPCGGAAEYYCDMDFLTDDWQPRIWEFHPAVAVAWEAELRPV